MKTGLKKIYVIGLHFVILILLGIIVLAISLIRADRRMPGSQLSATYSNTNDKWGHYIQHDGRDIVVGVSEQLFGVDHILVAPPGAMLVASSAPA